MPSSKRLLVGVLTVCMAEKLTPAATALGFVSDVHGNLEALEAVLAELARQDVSMIFACGDHVLGGDAPLETWRALQRVGARCVKGLSDHALATVDASDLAPHTEEETSRADAFLETQTALGELVVEQLRRLPETLRVPLIDGREILVVHASPADPGLEITHDMTDDELLDALHDDPADVVVCGASHVQFRRDVEGVAVVSVGSVGAALAERVAQFVVMRPRMDGLEVHLDFVGY